MSTQKTTNPKQIEGYELFDNWEEEKPYGYSDDQLIDAFQIGRKKGQSDIQKLVQEKFGNNLNKATTESEKLVKKIKQAYNISIKGMHLNIKDINSFAALIVVDEETYFSDEMEYVYDMIGDHELELEEDDFRLAFHFTGAKNELNKDAIISDGYTLRYKTEAARKAQ